MRRLLIVAFLFFGAAVASAAEVEIFAPASLSRVLAEAQKGLEGSLRLRLNLAGSQQLAAQIAAGARVDVFASADERWMREVEKGGFLVAPPRVFARNRLVVIVPAANPGNIAGLADLARPGVKLVLAAEPVPAGRYARMALANLSKLPSLGADYGSRVLADLVSEEENVQAVTTKVGLGEADAGIVYVTDAAGRSAELKTIEIPAEANVVAEYWVGVAKDGPNPNSAATFVKWLLGAPGQQLLATHGFLPAKE
jgi:molybdate transport system substrate-binding protein